MKDNFFLEVKMIGDKPLMEIDEVMPEFIFNDNNCSARKIYGNRAHLERTV